MSTVGEVIGAPAYIRNKTALENIYKDVSEIYLIKQQQEININYKETKFIIDEKQHQALIYLLKNHSRLLIRDGPFDIQGVGIFKLLCFPTKKCCQRSLSLFFISHHFCSI